jgi:hypothetical protein
MTGRKAHRGDARRPALFDVPLLDARAGHTRLGRAVAVTICGGEGSGLEEPNRQGVRLETVIAAGALDLYSLAFPGRRTPAVGLMAGA